MDIFCLQEVLFSDVQREIVAAVIDEYPYAFSAQDLMPTPSSNAMACTVVDLLTFEECFLQNCANFSGPLSVCISLK